MLLLRTSYSWHRPLMLTAYLCVLLLVASAIGLAADDRVINGEAAWLKPAKFSVSIIIYNVTIAWLLSLLIRWRRTGWWLGTVIAAGGRVAVSPSGNAGMASGGTGDVLAGLLGAWLDEDRLFERASAAVYAHGLAGDLAHQTQGDGLIAGDLIERFPRAWLELA
jgi:hypothetical protein